MEIRPPARHTAAQPAAPRPAATIHPGPTHTPRRKLPRNNKPLVVVIVVLLILACVAKFLYIRNNSAMGMVKSNEYQAVFLTNNQVYFGHVKKINRDYLQLENIYYFQAQQNVQNGQSKDQNQQLSLNKLGNELHGPEDAMYIERKQILFWENLKNDSKVVQAIKANH